MYNHNTSRGNLCWPVYEENSPHDQYKRIWYISLLSTAELAGELRTSLGLQSLVRAVGEHPGGLAEGGLGHKTGRSTSSVGGPAQPYDLDEASWTLEGAGEEERAKDEAKSW